VSGDLGNTVTDRGASHRYRTEIPNVVIELGLRPFSLALYVHLKRTAGDTGHCEKTTRRLADEMGGVSLGSISAAKADLSRPRDELDGKSLIEVVTVDDGKGTRYARDAITIVDIWPENMDRFGRAPGVESVHTVNGGRSDSERAVHTVNGGRSDSERGRSYTEHEEEPLRKNHRKNKSGGGGTASTERPRRTRKRAPDSAALAAPRPRDEFFDAHCKAFGADPNDPGDNAPPAKRFSTQCKRVGATLGQFREFYRKSRGEWGRFHFTPYGVTQAFLAWRVGKGYAGDPLPASDSLAAGEQQVNPEGAPAGWRDLVYFEYDGKVDRRSPQLVLPRLGLDPHAPRSAWPAWLQGVYGDEP